MDGNRKAYEDTLPSQTHCHPGIKFTKWETELNFQSGSLSKSQDHWIDQCTRIKEMSAEERLTFITENNAYISCLKKANKIYNMCNCKRRRRSMQYVDGVQCTFYHDPLLHIPVIIIIPVFPGT